MGEAGLPKDDFTNKALYLSQKIDASFINDPRKIEKIYSGKFGLKLYQNQCNLLLLCKNFNYGTSLCIMEAQFTAV